MRVRGLRSALVLLVASTGFCFAAGSARAQGDEAELAAGESGQREPQPAAPGARRRRDRGPKEAQQAAWWAHAREVLFRDIQLSAEQQRGVDAIIESQRAERRRADELRAELEGAREREDTQGIAALRTQLRASRAELKGPHARVEEMRELLTEEQRPTFDMNRARLASEGQPSGPARQGTRAKQPGADAGAAGAQ